MKNLRLLIAASALVVATLGPRSVQAQHACSIGVFFECYAQPYLAEELHATIYADAWHGVGVVMALEIYGSTAEMRMVNP